MTGSFAASALSWSSISARVLGWCPDQFWRATPAELLTSLCDPGRAREAGPSRAFIIELMERDANG